MERGGTWGCALGMQGLFGVNAGAKARRQKGGVKDGGK